MQVAGGGGSLADVEAPGPAKLKTQLRSILLWSPLLSVSKLDGHMPETTYHDLDVLTRLARQITACPTGWTLSSTAIQPSGTVVRGCEALVLDEECGCGESCETVVAADKPRAS